MKKTNIGSLMLLLTVGLCGCNGNGDGGTSSLEETSSSSSSSTSSTIEEPSVKNLRRNGTISLNVTGLSAFITGFGELHYNSGVSYSYGDRSVESDSDDGLNAELLISPSNGIEYQRDKKTISASESTIENYKALGNLFGFFDGLGSLVKGMLPEGLSNDFSSTYKAPSAYYSSIKKMEDDEISALDEKLSLSYTEDQGFVYALTDETGKLASSDYSKLRAYATKDNSVLKSIKGIVQAFCTSVGEGSFDVSAIDFIGLFNSLIPDSFDWSEEDNAKIVKMVVDILATGISGEKTTREDNGIQYTDVKFFINEEGISDFNSNVIPYLTEKLPDASMAISNMELSKLEFKLSSYLNDDGEYVFSGIGLNLDLKKVALILNPSISFDLVLNPAVAEISSSYFKELNEKNSVYSSLNDKFQAFYEKAGPYVKFMNTDSPMMNVDLSALDEGTALWAELKDEYSALEDDVKFMLGKSISDDTFNESNNPFTTAKNAIESLSVPSDGITSDNVEDTFKTISKYKNWRDGLSKYENGKKALAALDSYYEATLQNWMEWKKSYDADKDAALAEGSSVENVQKLILRATDSQCLPLESKTVKGADYFSDEQREELSSYTSILSDVANYGKDILDVFKQFIINHTVSDGGTQTIDKELLKQISARFDYSYSNGTYTVKETEDSFASSAAELLFGNSGIHGKLSSKESSSWTDSFISETGGVVKTALQEWADEVALSGKALLANAAYSDADGKNTFDSQYDKLKAEVDSIEMLTAPLTNQQASKYSSDASEMLAACKSVSSLIPTCTISKSLTSVKVKFNSVNYSISVTKDGNAYTLDSSKITRSGSYQTWQFTEDGSYSIVLSYADGSLPYTMTYTFNV